VAQKDDRLRLQLAIATLQAGEIEQAMELLRRPFEAPVSTIAVPILKALNGKPVEFWRTNSRLDDDRTKDVQVTRSPHPRGTVILPTGIAFGYLPLALVDSLFAAHDFNVIYLRDFNKRAYLRGVQGLGRTEEETILSLRGLTRTLGGRSTIVMGASQGGFAAMRYGALLEADFAISFAGATDLGPIYADIRPSIWHPDYFIAQILNRETDLPKDLVPVIAESSHTRFIQFYGTEAAGDIQQAQRLEGLPRVSLVPVPGVSDHFVIDHMIGDGSFDALLHELASKGQA
jgi:hypothetical protein